MKFRKKFRNIIIKEFGSVPADHEKQIGTKIKSCNRKVKIYRPTNTLK